MIVVTGASYSLGEIDVESRQILHPGLLGYIREYGIPAVNIGGMGLSNFHIAKQLEKFLFFNQSVLDITAVIIFQTDWIWDFRNDCEPVNNGYTKILNWHLDSFYDSLNYIAQQYNVKMFLIGGSVDVKLDNEFQTRWPDITVVCQSLINLLLNNNPYTSSPVYGMISYTRWFNLDITDSINTIRKNSPREEITQMLKDLDLATERLALIDKHPELFYPDGTHPNRLGHFQLFEHLKNNNIFKMEEI